MSTPHPPCESCPYRKLEGIIQPPTDPDALLAVSRLPDRQRTVLTRLASGLTVKAIAGELGLSPKTVEYHLAGLYARLHLRGVANLTRLAVRAGLVATAVLLAGCVQGSKLSRSTAAPPPPPPIPTQHLAAVPARAMTAAVAAPPASKWLVWSHPPAVATNTASYSAWLNTVVEVSTNLRTWQTLTNLPLTATNYWPALPGTFYRVGYHWLR